MLEQIKQGAKSEIILLKEEIELLRHELRRQNSFSRLFFHSVLRGLFTAIGATVVTALVFALVFQIVRSIDYVPIINGLLDSRALEAVLNRFGVR